MGRNRAARVAWYATQELDSYLRQRAWHWTVRRNYALAADYCIRLLNRHPHDPFGLALGEVSGRYTGQDAFREKCKDSLSQLVARRELSSANELLASPALGSPPREELEALLSDLDAEDSEKAKQAGALYSSDADERIVVKESATAEDIEKVVRRAGERAAAVGSGRGRLHNKSPLSSAASLSEPEGSYYGRGLVATRPIYKGEVLVLDEPLLVQRMDDIHCAHCLSPLARRSPMHSSADGTDAFGVPCPQCPEETYCSEACRSEAWERYHACSCSGVNPRYGEWSAAMRQLLMAEEDPHHEIEKAGSQARAALSCLAVGKLCAMATIQQVHPLALPGVSALRGVADYEPATALSEVGALAVSLGAALHQPNLYMEEILSLFALLQTNEVLLRGGLALFPVLSFMNHSCEPNCVAVPVAKEGDKHSSVSAAHQLVAVRPIHQGEQLFIDYNARLTNALDYEDRKALCAQRHFECFCPKCVRRE